jgi:hypothetical protein
MIRLLNTVCTATPWFNSLPFPFHSCALLLIRNKNVLPRKLLRRFLGEPGGSDEGAFTCSASTSAGYYIARTMARCSLKHPLALSRLRPYPCLLASQILAVLGLGLLGAKLRRASRSRNLPVPVCANLTLFTLQACYSGSRVGSAWSQSR